MVTVGWLLSGVMWCCPRGCSRGTVCNDEYFVCGSATMEVRGLRHWWWYCNNRDGNGGAAMAEAEVWGWR